MGVAFEISGSELFDREKDVSEQAWVWCFSRHTSCWLDCLTKLVSFDNFYFYLCSLRHCLRVVCLGRKCLNSFVNFLDPKFRKLIYGFSYAGIVKRQQLLELDQ